MLARSPSPATARTRPVRKQKYPLSGDQAGHHGSLTSSSEPFLDAVDPDVAVVSSALGSQYGHSHDEVLEAFADRGIETYRTGSHGDVVPTTDGTDVSVGTEREIDSAASLERKHEARSGLDPPLALDRPPIEI